MAIMDLEVLDIPVGDSIRLLITARDESSPLNNLQGHAFLPVGWKTRPSNRGPGPLRYYSYPDDGGKQSLSLYEGTSYFWKIYPDTGHRGTVTLPRLISSIGQGSQCRWSERDLGVEGKEGEFRVVNYLGTAWIGIDGAEFRLFFDLISKKLDFFEEYRSIVEDIAIRCNQLLQEFGSPATLRFEVDHERDAITLLERFLFLKSVLSPEKLTRYFDAIRTFSRSRIEKHRERIPLGYSPGYGFLRDPLKFGLGWRGLEDGRGGDPRFLPESIIEEYSNEIPDTPPNRFVKYALNYFRQICLDVLDTRGDRKSRGTAVLEAIELRDVIEEVLQDRFWDEVGAMENLPLGNPELQMKVGYREILNIWLLVDLGSRLDWEGRGQVYDGNTRDVPTLYEYWLYFQLFSILREIGFDYVPGSHSMTSGGIPPFINDRSGRGFTINLKRGYPSVSVFHYRPDPSLRIHFYYDRTFEKRPYPGGHFAPGSYSRKFRPDFTLAIFYQGAATTSADPLFAEKAAERDGLLSYVHFDAKYRIDRFVEIMGANGEEDLAGNAEESADEGGQYLEFFDTYVRADILKMHTYNDAIRRTSGAFVLYPGKDEDSDVMRKFHEILPGVGAFRMKPDHSGFVAGRSILKKFLEDMVLFYFNRNSQLYRLNRCSYEILSHAPLPNRVPFVIPGEYRPPEEILVLTVPIEPYNGLISGSSFLLPATNGEGLPVSPDRRFFKSSYILPYSFPEGKFSLGKVLDINMVHSISKSIDTVKPPQYDYFYKVTFSAVAEGSITDFSVPPGSLKVMLFSELWKIGVFHLITA